MAIVRELITILGFKVQESKIIRAEKAVKKYTKTAKMAARATKGLNSQLATFGRSLLGLTTGAFAVRGIVRELTEFERLSAILVTLTGSTEAAARQFRFIDEFARTTPFNIDQVTRAYQRLNAVGIQPTRRMLDGLGKIAAAMGSDIERLVEGTVQLQSGLTRQLKNVLKAQIRLSERGRKARFEIRGQVFEIENTTENVLALLTRIGETEFQGGMARLMERLPGLFSNAVDAVKRFVRAMGKGGLTAALERLLRAFIGTTEETMEFGELVGRVLGAPINTLAAALEFVREHADLFRMALLALGAVIVRSGLTALVWALTAALGAMGLSITKATLPLWAIGAAFAAVILLVQDLWVFMMGGESAIGVWVESMSEAGGILGAFADGLIWLRDNGDVIIERVADAFGFLADIIKDIASTFTSIFGGDESEFVEEMERQAAGVDQLLDANERSLAQMQAARDLARLRGREAEAERFQDEANTLFNVRRQLIAQEQGIRRAVAREQAPAGTLGVNDPITAAARRASTPPKAPGASATNNTTNQSNSLSIGEINVVSPEGLGLGDEGGLGLEDSVVGALESAWDRVAPSIAGSGRAVD